MSAALDAVIAQRGGGADDVAAEAEDGSGRGRVVEQLAELLLTLNAGTADTSRRAGARASCPSSPSPTRSSTRGPRRQRTQHSAPSLPGAGSADVVALASAQASSALATIVVGAGVI